MLSHHIAIHILIKPSFRLPPHLISPIYKLFNNHLFKFTRLQAPHAFNPMQTNELQLKKTNFKEFGENMIWTIIFVYPIEILQVYSTKIIQNINKNTTQ